MLEEYRVEEFLYMSWLRPENVVWDSVGSKLIGATLSADQNILEVGIGNGYFSFMTLGGKFNKKYDFYYNVNTNGFWENKDIYDCFIYKDIQNQIIKNVDIKIKYAIDYKINLLNQVKQLYFAENLICQDANEKINLSGIDTIYSNIIYWLKHPIEVIKNFESNLNDGGKVILVFPNTNFLKYCNSYRRDTRIKRLLNRGRGESLMWYMDIKDFQQEINSQTTFKIASYDRYLAPITLKVWDIGLRPISPHLIKMANSLDKKRRFEIKQEWCETCLMFLKDLLEEELENGPKNGGFNFVILEK